MKVQEFAEGGNSYAQTMDLAARDAHATALPWNSVPSEPKTLLVLTELTDEEYWSLVRKNFFRPVAELVKDILNCRDPVAYSCDSPSGSVSCRRAWTWPR